MPYYRVCPYCGNNLDPGEKCDCQTEKPQGHDKKPPVMRKPQRMSVIHEKHRILAATTRKA